MWKHKYKLINKIKTKQNKLLRHVEYLGGDSPPLPQCMVLYLGGDSPPLPQCMVLWTHTIIVFNSHTFIELDTWLHRFCYFTVYIANASAVNTQLDLAYWNSVMRAIILLLALLSDCQPKTSCLACSRFCISRCHPRFLVFESACIAHSINVLHVTSRWVPIVKRPGNF